MADVAPGGAQAADETVEAVKNPGETLEGIEYALENPGEAWEALKGSWRRDVERRLHRVRGSGCVRQKGDWKCHEGGQGPAGGADRDTGTDARRWPFPGCRPRGFLTRRPLGP